MSFWTCILNAHNYQLVACTTAYLDIYLCDKIYCVLTKPGLQLKKTKLKLILKFTVATELVLVPTYYLIIMDPDA